MTGRHPYGLIVGFAGVDDGLLGAVESGVVIGVLWGIFAGAFTKCGRAEACPLGA